jgi:hypothetical protein
VSVHTDLHFCLIGLDPPVVKGRAHPDMADTIEVSVKIGHASFVVSGRTVEVRDVLSRMLGTALGLTPSAQGAPPAEAAK